MTPRKMWGTLVAVALAAALAACGPTTAPEPAAKPEPSDGPSMLSEGPASQEQAYALRTVVDATRPVMAEYAKGEAAAMFSKIEVNGILPATLEYRYTYVDTMEPTAAARYFDTTVPALQRAVDEHVAPAMKGAGVTKPRVRYTYCNPDGSELWSHTFDET